MLDVKIDGIENVQKMLAQLDDKCLGAPCMLRKQMNDGFRGVRRN